MNQLLTNSTHRKTNTNCPYMLQKIILKEDLSLEELEKKIQNGGRFISYQYCISIFFALCLKRFSPAVFIEEPKLDKKYMRKCNTLSLLLGWWSLWGPYYTIGSLRVNRKGGIDMTEDIMLNIDQESLTNRLVKMEVTQQFYMKPDRWDIKEFKKAFLPAFEKDYNLRKLVVGRFINTKEDELPYLTIGVELENNRDIYPDQLRTAYETRFKKSSSYLLIDLKEESEDSKLLEEQGEFIIKR